MHAWGGFWGGEAAKAAIWRLRPPNRHSGIWAESLDSYFIERVTRFVVTVLFTTVTIFSAICGPERRKNVPQISC